MQAGPAREMHFMEEDVAGLLLQGGGILFHPRQLISVHMQAQGDHVPRPILNRLGGRESVPKRGYYVEGAPGVTLVRDPRPAHEVSGNLWIWRLTDVDDGVHEVVYHVFGGDDRDVNASATWRAHQVYIEVEHGCLRRLFFLRADAEAFAVKGIRERQERDAAKRKGAS